MINTLWHKYLSLEYYIMAKLVEEILVVKFSKIVKSTEQDTPSVLTSEIEMALEQVAQELIGDSVIVEVVKP